VIVFAWLVLLFELLYVVLFRIRQVELSFAVFIFLTVAKNHSTNSPIPFVGHGSRPKNCWQSINNTVMDLEPHNTKN